MTTPARRAIAASWSGGKDSTMMLERLRDDPTIEVAALLTTVSTIHDRISIHGVRRSILRKQAAALGLPLIEVALGATSSNDDYAAAFTDGLQRLAAAFPSLNTMAFGDLYLDDVRQYRESLLQRAGWSGVYPLWGEPTQTLAQYFVRRAYRAILTCVDTTQLDADFAGRTFDASLLRDLPASVDPCGENGEFHTCVLSGPIFADAIAVTHGERVLRDGRFQYCDLIDG